MFESGVGQLRYILKSLIDEAGVPHAEIAKVTKVPESTIFRLTSGSTNNPQITTIKSLAEFFGVTIGQLIGIEPLELNTSTTINNSAKNLQKIPEVTWHQVYNWHDLSTKINEKTHANWLYSDQIFSPKNSFALIVKTDQYKNIFPKKSTIYVDCSVPERDCNFAVISDLTTKKSSIKKIIKDSNATYLVHPQESISTIKSNNDLYIGTITGVKISFDKDFFEDID